METLSWVFKKILLPPNAVIFLGKDASLDSGTKGYTHFKDSQELINFLEDTKYKNPHFYEIIPDVHKYSTLIFFDLDRIINAENDTDILQNPITYFDLLMEKFIEYFQAFLKTIYDHEVSLTIGENVNIGYSITNKKLSAHVRINIRCQNMIFLKTVAQNFDRYLSSNKYIDDTYRRLFYFTAKNGAEGRTKLNSIIDQSIYCNFRLFRTIYSSKLQTGGTPLLPYKKSSVLIKDHIVIYHPTIHGTHIFTLNDTNVEISTDYSKIDKQMITTTYTKDMFTDTNDYQISPEKLKEIKEMLIHSPEVHKLLQTTEIIFSNIKQIIPSDCLRQDTYYQYILQKPNKCYCPYAKRIHDNNRSYFLYNDMNRKIQYKCYADECKEQNKYITMTLTYEKDYILRHNVFSNRNTLHCKQDVIKWNEIYEIENMTDYPEPEDAFGIVLIRANMGIGKTKSLNKTFIPQNVDSNTKCIFITYQRILAKKYHKELAEYGFIHYLDVEGEISDKKIVVCLDSIARVQTTSFDYVFIDEALSVFMHMNSSQMKNKALISIHLESILLDAKHVYMLDAHIDNLIVYKIAEYLSIEKNTQIYSIRNKFIRPTNRNAICILNKNKKSENTLKMKLIEHVCELLKYKKRVVVSSSTKSFTEQLQLEVKRRFKERRNIFIYNSDTDRAILNNHSENTESVWKTLDLLVYSPTITAGVSFESLHFHQLISYIDNSLYTPTVDNVMQQLFRVRCLIDGNMTLYVNDTINFCQNDYPVHEHEIVNWLDTNINQINKFYPNDSMSYESNLIRKENKIVYDKDRLSFDVLTGIVYNKNKSLQQFLGTIIKTLNDDYNIACEVQDFELASDLIKKTIAFQKRWKKFKAENDIPFSQDLVVSSIIYEELCKKKNREESMNDNEKLQLWVYDAAFEWWGIQPQKIDSNFFKKYIGQCDGSSINTVIELHHSASRFIEAISHELDDNKSRFQNKLKWIKNQDDPNLDLYDKKSTEFYNKLIEGQEILESLLNRDQYKNLEHESITISDFTKFYTLLKSMPNDKYEFIVKLYDLERKCWWNAKNEIIETSSKGIKKRNLLINNILYQSFGLRMSDNGCKDPKSKKYGLKILETTFDDLINVYQVRLFINNSFDFKIEPDEADDVF